MFDVFAGLTCCIDWCCCIGCFVELLFSAFSGGCLLFDLFGVVGLGYFACGGFVC